MIVIIISYNMSISTLGAGQLDYDIALDLSSYIKKEDKYVPWDAFVTGIDFLDTMLSTQDSYGKFQVKPLSGESKMPSLQICKFYYKH